MGKETSDLIISLLKDIDLRSGTPDDGDTVAFSVGGGGGDDALPSRLVVIDCENAEDNGYVCVTVTPYATAEGVLRKGFEVPEDRVTAVRLALATINYGLARSMHWDFNPDERTLLCYNFIAAPRLDGDPAKIARDFQRNIVGTLETVGMSLSLICEVVNGRRDDVTLEDFREWAKAYHLKRLCAALDHAMKNMDDKPAKDEEGEH